MKSLVTCCLLSVALALGSVASAYGQGKIAFTRRGEIYVASIGHAGKLGSERNVTNDPSIDSRPSWSHDGRRLSFVSTRGGTLQLYVMDFDGTEGSNVRLMTEEEMYFVPAGWSPTEPWLAYVGAEGVLRKVWGDDGSPPVEVADLSDLGLTAYGLSSPVWSPDGTKIALAGWPLTIVDVERGEMAPIEGLDVGRIDWSDRGIVLALDEPSRIAIIDEVGRTLEEYPLPGLAYVQNPTASPDSNRVLLQASPIIDGVIDGQFRSYVVDLATGAVVDAGVGGSFPDWAGGPLLTVDVAPRESLPVAWGELKVARRP